MSFDSQSIMILKKVNLQESMSSNLKAKKCAKNYQFKIETEI